MAHTAQTPSHYDAGQLMAALGRDGPLTIGNATTGETRALPPQIAALVRDMLTRLATGENVAIAAADTGRAEGRAALDALYAIEREDGPVDGPPPAKSVFRK